MTYYMKGYCTEWHILCIDVEFLNNETGKEKDR